MSRTVFLKGIAEKQRKGENAGILSVCSANDFVIRAAMERAGELDRPVLIESTCNQVNQFGGYTGMTPGVFSEYIYRIAGTTGFDRKNIILGGDHLGPGPWADTGQQAMDSAGELIRDCVLAGYVKIHIDTSMKLSGDNTDKVPDPLIVAERGAKLCEIAEKAYDDLLAENPDAEEPVYVLGSEVPVPGGSSNEKESVEVTKASDFRETYRLYKRAFEDRNLESAWKRVIAFVVQPGVEFGNESVHEYNRDNACKLCMELQNVHTVFEGHSTDYQTREKLRQMAEDGIAILKAGPALTFAMREAVMMLELIERELYEASMLTKLSNFSSVLIDVMQKNPRYWKKYYHGSKNRRKLDFKYSYSDRSRYYMNDIKVKNALYALTGNLKPINIPMTLVSQYMPEQYRKIRAKALIKDPEAMIMDRIKEVLDDYHYAAGVID